MGTRMRAWLSVGMAAVCALLMAAAPRERRRWRWMRSISRPRWRSVRRSRRGQPVCHRGDRPCEQEIRRWSRPEPETLPEAGPEEMRGLLTALGLDQDVVASYSLERLEEFCSAETITVHSAYLRTEEDGTVSYHTREEALAELTADQKRETGDAWMNLRVGWTSGSKGPEGDLFTVTALWLTQPAEDGRT